MKRVVTIAVIMAIVTSLFSFSVFAETDFNYATSVSNQDIINGLVITLKANRGSLINTGTAALGYSGYCPILITVTLQNTNNQNVLVNNLKFKMTTNSSGNFSRIVSFEQLSNDLIIAETPYDLNNYISIVPSNEYSYGSGIVVPANSTMYMVCLMNVYANYDTSSNQWQVPSLQYIGYDQSITVNTGNYNATGVPIDLSDVTESLEELISIVSSEDTLLEIIDLVTYSGVGPTIINGNITTTVSEITGYNGLTFRASQIIMPGHYISDDFEFNSSNDNLYEVGTVVYPVILTTYYRNATDYDYRLRYFYNLQNALPQLNNGISFDFKDYNTDYAYYRYESGRTIAILPYNSDSSYSYLAKRSSGYSSIIIYIYCAPGVTPVWSTFSVNIGSTVPTQVQSSPGSSKDLFGLIQELVRSLVKSNNVDNTEIAEEMNDDIHEAEQVWYDNNSEALEQVGLSNYRFNNNQTSGIYQAVTQFQAVWNALGQWTNVYIFILILSISTYIIRHEPTTRVKQYRSSVQAERAERISYYGKKNAEARASGSDSTLKNAIRRRR